MYQELLRRNRELVAHAQAARVINALFAGALVLAITSMSSPASDAGPVSASTRNYGCGLLAAVFWAKGLGSTGLSAAGTDAFAPWEPGHTAKRLVVEFCDPNYAARVIALTRGKGRLEHVIITKQIDGPIFDLHGVSAERTGVEQYVSLHFTSMSVTMPTRSPT
jgi:hypothetical protein